MLPVDVVNVETVKVVSSSVVATLITTDRVTGTIEQQEWGKRFEEAYQYTCWTWNRFPWKEPPRPGKSTTSICPSCGTRVAKRSFNECEWFHRKWHQTCGGVLVGNYKAGRDRCRVSCRQCIGTAIIGTFKEKMGDDPVADRIAIAFMRAGIRGVTPKTYFRETRPGYYIAAKPDLHDTASNSMHEFKTYDIRDYAIAQCKVFSWVIGMPVFLSGWDGKIVHRKTITSDGIVIPPIPDDWFNDIDASRVSPADGIE
jgi:hypothetical protein